MKTTLLAVAVGVSAWFAVGPTHQIDADVIGGAADNSVARGADNDDECDLNYPFVCIPPPPPDLNCGDLDFDTFSVGPADPHRLDTDGDGIACEASGLFSLTRTGLSTQLLMAGLAATLGLYGTFAALFGLARMRRHETDRFFRALLRITQEDATSEQSREQLTMVFREMSRHSSSFSKAWNDPSELVESFIANHSTLGDQEFDERMGTPRATEQRRRALLLLGHMREAAPYPTLPPHFSNALHTLDRAVARGNEELARSATAQLSEHIGVQESRLASAERRGRIGVLVTVVGIAIAIVSFTFSVIQVVL